jgi:hypothetical protein
MPVFSWGQNNWRPTVGAHLGVLFGFGSHQNDLGFKLDTYIGNSYFQLNAGYTGRFFLTNLGKRTNFWESRTSFGAVIMWGKKSNPLNMDWDGALHQTRTPYSIGFQYLLYHDRKGSSQVSGAWNIGIQRVDILLENDVFGGLARDGFRTGSLVVSYRDSLQKASIGLTIWTGDTRKTTWIRETREGMPNGYRDLTNNPYGKLNHGILYGEWKTNFYLGQTAGVRFGWDSEQIRHVFQNRISHDLIWLPKKIQRNTPHYPRLSDDGRNVFQRSESRKPKFYHRVFLNDGLPY